MSYGHADKLLAATGGMPADPPGGAIPRDSKGRVLPPRPDPALWDKPEMRSVLAVPDITALYCALTKAGISQHGIAKLTGQTQSEVSEIIKGRRVIAYDTMTRIADGLGVPRGYMGLAYTDGKDGANGAYPEGDAGSDVEEVDGDVIRRDVLARGSVALVGVPVLGKLLGSSAGPGELGLPSQVGMRDVAEIKNTTEQLRVAARRLGGQARAVSAAAQYGRLLPVPASEEVRRQLLSQLAELNELAGLCCFDSGMDLHAR